MFIINTFVINFKGKSDTLTPDQIYACDLGTESTEQKQSEMFQSIERQPFADRVFKVKHSPYIAHLYAIKDKYLERPTSLYDKARYLLFSKCVHYVSLPVFFVSLIFSEKSCQNSILFRKY